MNYFTSQERIVLFSLALLIIGGSILRFTTNHRPLSPNPTSVSVQKDRLDINTANQQQLTSIPGIGPTLAQRIITYRQQIGSFKTIHDLLNISGIGSKKLSSIQHHIVINEITSTQ